MTYDSRPDTWKHIDRVRFYLNRATINLIRRGENHDWTKLESPELEAFDIATPKLANLVYGSPEYKAAVKELGSALEHHYAHNSHHPEFGEPGIEWVEVHGYEGLYEVSNYGDVKSLARTVKREGDRGDLSIPERIMKAQLTPKGYLRIQLQRESSSANKMVHVLVAQAFIPNPDGKPEVNHLDGVKSNNHVSNLEWVTPSENQQHAYDTGLKEPRVKYVVYCPDLDLTTFGAQAMERALLERGHAKASAAGIWGAMDRGGRHLGMTFEGTLLAEWRRSVIAKMSLLDLLEMVCDWKAASERMRKPTPAAPGRPEAPEYNSDFHRSVLLNQERWGYSDELCDILINTAIELRFIGPEEGDS